MIWILNFNSISEAYPIYLGGDRNYLLAYAHTGTGLYIDKKTLAIEKYDPPTYVISFDVVFVSNADRGNTEISGRERQCWLYKWDEQKMYILRDNSWIYFKPIGTCHADVGTGIGEMAFYIAYKMKFYGGIDWYDPKFPENKILAVNGDHIYLIVDGSE